MKSISFLLIVLAAGLQAGVNSGWQGVLPQVFNNLHYSDTQGGWLGFGNSLANVIGGTLIGPVSDKFFRRRFKLLLIILYCCCVACFVWFTLSLPTPFTSAELIPTNYPVLMVAISAAGFFQGMLGPVSYELIAELVYPVPEATSGGMMVLLFNASTLIFLFVSPEIDANWMNLIITGTMVASLVMVLFVVEKYNRADAELAITRTKQKIREVKRQRTEDMLKALEGKLDP